LFTDSRLHSVTRARNGKPWNTPHSPTNNYLGE
jgi:hypothetical protein